MNAKDKTGLLVITPWTQAPNKPIPDIRRITSYRGLDGKEAWPEDPTRPQLTEGLAKTDQYIDVLRYAEQLSGCRVIYIDTDTMAEKPQIIKKDFRLLGYDYGYYLSEDNYYSVLLNEVIYGSYEQLRLYTKDLNEFMLFPSADLGISLEQTRRQLRDEGADIEIDEKSEIIAIHELI